MATRRARSPSTVVVAGKLFSLNHPDPDSYVFRLTKGPEVLSITVGDTADAGRGFGSILVSGPFAATEYSDDFTALIGDNVTKIFDVAHGFGTKDVEVHMRKVSDDEHHTVGWIALDTNTARLEFRDAPTTDEFSVTVRAMRAPA